MQTRSQRSVRNVRTKDAPFVHGPQTFQDLRNRSGLEVKVSQNHGEIRWRPMTQAQSPQILHLLGPQNDLRLQSMAAACVLLEMARGQ